MKQSLWKTTGLSLPRRKVHCRPFFAARACINECWASPLYADFWRLYILRGDGAALVVDDHRMALKPGRLYLIPPYFEGRGSCHKEVEQWFVHFRADELDGAWSTGLLDRPVAVADDELLEALAVRCFGARLEDPDHLWIQCLVTAVVGSWIKGLAGVHRTALDRHLNADDPVAPALALLNRDLRVQVSDMAAACGFCRDHFTRIFRVRFGCTPQQYLLKHRVAAASERLCRYEDSIEQIAVECGFANRNHFTRVFTRLTGSPPATFRKRARTV